MQQGEMKFEADRCPLCGAGAHPYHRDRRRAYLQCSTCQLVFVPPEAFLSVSDEKAEYDLHQNSPDDLGYRKFLSRMMEPIAARIPTGGSGLDFGSGPGPTLSVMLEECGYEMSLYDLYYAPDESILTRRFDFVTATEVLEHLRGPRDTLERMWGCVKAGGYLGVMTKLVIGPEAFSRWHYKNDATHICFFSHQTLTWIANMWQAELEFIGTDVALLRRPFLSKCAE